jgi:xanthine dehydrogenase accessory factor
MAPSMTARVSELVAGRVPFVRAKVVRAQSPTSARAGDDAIVLADGTMEGFVGGQCAQESVRTAAMAALRDGEAVLLRVLPDGDDVFPAAPGAKVVVNPCLSGGAIEIFLEPSVPAPLIHLVGQTPIADAVAALADPLGFAVGRAEAGQRPDGAVAVIVSSLGGDEAQSIRAALDAQVPFIGLVAGRRRGASVLEAMDLTEDEHSRIRTHVGLEIGARTPEEIALSIVADIVRAIRVDGIEAVPTSVSSLPQHAVDPICGMTVVVLPDTPHLNVDGQDYWFCNPGCRDRFAEQSGR